MLLRLDAVGRSLGARTLFRDVGLAVYAGDRIGIVGPNGAGKTTLLRIAAGEEPPDTGRVRAGRDVRVGMLRQEIDPRLRAACARRSLAYSRTSTSSSARSRSSRREMARSGARARRSPRISPTATTARARSSSSAAASRARRASSACSGGLGFAEPARPAALELQRRLADARRAGEAAALRARRAAARRADQPSRSALDRVVRGDARGVPRRRADRLPRPDLPAPSRDPGGRARERALHASSRAATTAS